MEYTEDTRKAGIAPSRLPPRRPVSRSGENSIRVCSIGICGHCMYRDIRTLAGIDKLYI